MLPQIENISEVLNGIKEVLGQFKGDGVEIWKEVLRLCIFNLIKLEYVLFHLFTLALNLVIHEWKSK